MAFKSGPQLKPGPAVRFWDRIADKYARTKVRDEKAYQAKLEHIRSLLRPDMDVMEFGCGTGSTALALAGCVKHIHATDISPRMIEIAEGKAKAADIQNVRFEAIAFEECEVLANSLDVVMGHSILHLLDDYVGAIAKVHAMLKPGGHFISSTTCLNDGFWFLRPIMPIGQLFGFFPPVAFFTGGQLVDSLEQQGFTIDYRWKPAKRSAEFIVATKVR